MAGYASRQATYSDGDTILATHSNSEFNQILAGFNASTGHKHDGTAGEGATIDIIIDNDSDTKITVENSADEDTIRFFTGVGGQQFNIVDGKIEPQTDNDLDLGSASKGFKNLYVVGTTTLAGTVFTGTLDMNGLKIILDADADTSITADTDDQIDFELSGADDFRMTANTFTALSGSTISVPTGATLDVSGGTLTLANDQISGDKVHGGTISGSVTIVSPTITTSPTAAGATWTDLGTVTTADINGGTIDGVTIGGASAGAVTTSSLVATTADINAGTVDNTVVGGTTPAAGTFTTLTATTLVAPFPRNWIAGLLLSNNGSDASNDIDVSVGECRDAANTGNMSLAASITKRLDASWAVGTNQGGLDTGAEASGTLYAVWLIKRTDTSVVDVLFSTSFSAPTMPADYTLKRLIGWIYNDGSSVIQPFTHTGDLFRMNGPLQIFSDSTLTATTYETATCPVPPYAIIEGALTHSETGTKSDWRTGLKTTGSALPTACNNFTNTQTMSFANATWTWRATVQVSANRQVDYGVQSETTTSSLDYNCEHVWMPTRREPI